MSPYKVLTWQMSLGVPVFLALSACLEGVSAYHLTLPVMAALLYQGIVVAGLCFVVQIHLLRKHPQKLRSCRHIEGFRSTNRERINESVVPAERFHSLIRYGFVDSPPAKPAPTPYFALVGNCVTFDPASQLTAFALTTPLWGVTFSHLLLNDPLSRHLLLGGALVVTGIALADRRDVRCGSAGTNS
jgi:drug/metabolite transporter (DMT)-like permease